MAVFVKRFRVRFNGVTYGPGQPGGTVITGLSEEEEARLIAGSNGAVVKYMPVEVAEEAEEKKSGLSRADFVTESVAEEDVPLEDAKIPEIKPEELIKPKKVQK